MGMRQHRPPFRYGRLSAGGLLSVPRQGQGLRPRYRLRHNTADNAEENAAAGHICGGYTGAIEQLRLGLEKSETSGIVPICADLKELWEGAPLGQLDLVTCNPPYKVNNAGFQSVITAQKIARHEILCTIDDVCAAAQKLLKFGGRLCVCNRPERLSDVIFAMKNHDIEPKRLRFVSKNADEAPWLFLIEGKKGSKPFMKVEPQLYIRSENGFTDELQRIYDTGKEQP